MLAVHSHVSSPKIGKSDLIQTIMEPKNEDRVTTEKVDESAQWAEGNKRGDATGPNPLAEENEKLKKEIEKLKQENEMLKKVKSRTNEVKPGSLPGIIPLTKRCGRMAKEDRRKFIDHMSFLIEELHPKDLIAMMFSKFLINEDEEEILNIILENQGRKRCAEKMLVMLLRCGRYAYTIFLKCLELTGYRNVIKKLEPNCEIFEGNIKYPGQQYHELITNDHPNREAFIRKIEGELEEIYDETELVVITTLTKGCVQVTFHLISLGSKSENELREILEQKVKSGYIGENKVSTEGFSFKKIEGNGEETVTDRSVVQDSQLVTQENFNKLKEKIDELEGFNMRLLQHIAELETELEEGDAVDVQPGIPNYDKTDATGYSSRLSEATAAPVHEEPMMSVENFDTEEYDMNHVKRGMAIIINNRYFEHMVERTGTDKDVKSLTRIFQKLGFYVECFQDLPRARMKSVLTRAASEDHSDSDCFVCAILSHGEEESVFGIDGPIEIKELLAPFKGDNCRSLTGKPKIFFIEAGFGFKLDDGAIRKDGGVEVQDKNTQIIPTEADFLIVNAAVPGFLSWRNIGTGSWFVQALCEVFQKYGTKLELLSMMTMVNKMVGYHFESKIRQENIPRIIQMPYIVSMLTKNVYFRPKAR
ncbi:uncharacterized protein LOC126814955 isoform X2 [Patella vulgata]|uniref:uncharacterized protein LOC126814955 isoform X2 n=1 Tax=Patella vulgata TaxID=6465 RepID=UPI0024A9498E|nr:uncharacterized protein LOC126814955 isoform X2 [Patella vulgata]